LLIHLFLCMFCSSSECKGEDKVIQEQGDVTAAEGVTVTLNCKYETTSTYAYLFWYKQEVNKFPQYIQVKGTEINMSISSAAVTDSAVYYCALQPTVTGNTKTLYKNLWSKDNRILHNIH
uniref:Ig-like domain-containing protein n=1 Tax=Oreochromis niloticus TaxID=8128 RepID=A0A669BYF3_ORENI